jgi:hypothetical protein
MQCPVCEKLLGEHAVACATEAIATLEERSAMLPQSLRKGPGRATSEHRQETILASRKQQLKIASCLENHRNLAHPVKPALF